MIKMISSLDSRDAESLRQFWESHVQSGTLPMESPISFLPHFVLTLN